MRKRSRRALLVAGGEDLVGERRFRRLVEEADCILAADGGYDALRSIGVEPQLVLGDFDSSALLKERADQEAARKRGLQLLSYPVKKDATDSQLALDLLLEEGYEAVLLLGGSGSRADHSLANLFLLHHYARLGLFIGMESAHNQLVFLPGGNYDPISFPGDPYVSFLTTDEGVRLSLKGFEYPLEDQLLPPYSSLGVSNHIRSDQARIKLQAPPGCGAYFLISQGGDQDFFPVEPLV